MMKLPLSKTISRAQKMLPELDPADVEDTINEMRFLPDGAAAAKEQLEKHRNSKPVKQALQRHALALRKILQTRRALLEQHEFYVFITLDRESNVFEEMLNKELAAVERLLLQRRPARPSPFEPMLRVAAKTARNLLIRAGRRLVVKSESEWCKLAAILAGEPSRDLYQVVREVNAELKPGSK
jgi:hypothetical protein